MIHKLKEKHKINNRCIGQPNLDYCIHKGITLRIVNSFQMFRIGNFIER